LLILVDASARGERANMRFAVPPRVRAGENLRPPCCFGYRRHAKKEEEALVAVLGFF
jgi:hypothetical protein